MKQVCVNKIETGNKIFIFVITKGFERAATFALAVFMYRETNMPTSFTPLPTDLPCLEALSAIMALALCCLLLMEQEREGEGWIG